MSEGWPSLELMMGTNVFRSSRRKDKNMRDRSTPMASLRKRPSLVKRRRWMMIMTRAGTKHTDEFVVPSDGYIPPKTMGV